MSSRRYQVTVDGTLGERFASGFQGMTVERGAGQTTFTGDLEQAQLSSLLDRLGDLGLQVLHVAEVVS